MPRNKVRNPSTAVTHWPAVDQSGLPIRAKVQEIVDATPGGSGTGDVVGPASAVNNDVAVFDGVTGKLVKDSGVLVGNLVLTSDARLTNARTPTAHHASHENGGADEISVAGLSGLLADGQTPLTHAASHAAAGSDPLTLTEAQITNLVTDLAAKASFAQALTIASFRG